MPELPEVETVARALRKSPLIGATIKEIVVFWEPIIALGKEKLPLFLGEQITGVERRGKFLIFFLSSTHRILLHLRMTGRVSLILGQKKREPHEHLFLRLQDDLTLVYHDTRKFGRFYFTDSKTFLLEHLGKEPLGKEFTLEWFTQILKKTKSRIKPLLLDQHVIAGLGNIYVDESLWLASIHPERAASSLTSAESKRLFQAIPRVLEEALCHRGTSLGEGLPNFHSLNGRGEHQHHLKVFRRQGKNCLRCQKVLIRKIVAQRSSHFCPSCQKSP